MFSHGAIHFEEHINDLLGHAKRQEEDGRKLRDYAVKAFGLIKFDPNYRIPFCSCLIKFNAETYIDSGHISALYPPT